AEPSEPIIVTEGEKKADRAIELFPDYEATTTMGGAKAPQLSDFAVFAGRALIVWPDNDRAGREYADRVTELALAAGASRVAIVNLQASFQRRWALADPFPAGVTLNDLRQLLETQGRSNAKRCPAIPRTTAAPSATNGRSRPTS